MRYIVQDSVTEHAAPKPTRTAAIGAATRIAGLGRIARVYCIDDAEPIGELVGQLTFEPSRRGIATLEEGRTE